MSIILSALAVEETEYISTPGPKPSNAEIKAVLSLTGTMPSPSHQQALPEHLSKHGNVRLPAGLLPLRIEVHCLALRPGVIVREGDAVTAYGNRYNIGGDDPEFTRVDGEAVVVEDRLAIKP